jgi:hypothetical protein
MLRIALAVSAVVLAAAPAGASAEDVQTDVGRAAVQLCRTVSLESSLRFDLIAADIRAVVRDVLAQSVNPALVRLAMR